MSKFPSMIWLITGAAMESAHSTSAYDHLLKILVIGDVNSNKRALLRRYIGEQELSDNTTLGEGVRREGIIG